MHRFLQQSSKDNECSAAGDQVKVEVNRRKERWQTHWDGNAEHGYHGDRTERDGMVGLSSSTLC